MLLIGITAPESFSSLHMVNFKLPRQPERKKKDQTHQVPLNVLNILTVQNVE